MRAIEDELEAQPSLTWTLSELAATVYPGAQFEKKHSVAILRALRGIALPWAARSSGAHGAPYVIYRKDNLRSLAVGMTRTGIGMTTFDGRVRSDAEIEACLMGSKRQWIATDGAYPILVQYNREPDEAARKALWEQYQARVHTCVYRPERIKGEIHPDFLRDCRTGKAD